jgi:DNA processing protein
MQVASLPSGAPVVRAYEPPNLVRQLDSTVRGGVCLPTLYVAGDVALLSRACVAVIGSRAASSEACKAATRLASDLAETGFVVVSGLAKGVDAAAHRGAMSVSGGRTVAVIGTPLERAYPRQHASLQEAIYRHHLLVSPFAEGTRTTLGHFPARNRVMARLTDATVLVDAAERSGTVHQVLEAIAVGRPVFVPRRLVGQIGWITDLVNRQLVSPWVTSADLLERVARRLALGSGDAAQGPRTPGAQ